jgi:hypothetical protein
MTEDFSRDRDPKKLIQKLAKGQKKGRGSVKSPAPSAAPTRRDLKESSGTGKDDWRVQSPWTSESSPILPPPVNREQEMMDRLREKAYPSLDDAGHEEGVSGSLSDHDGIDLPSNALLCPFLDGKPCLGGKCAVWSWEIKDCSFQVQGKAYTVFGDFTQRVTMWMRHFEPLLILLSKF